jgi:hypothetical protein
VAPQFVLAFSRARRRRLHPVRIDPITLTRGYSGPCGMAGTAVRHESSA